MNTIVVALHPLSVHTRVRVLARPRALCSQVTFKWELLFYPGVGSCMWLAGYVPVKRGDKASGMR